MRLTAEHDLAMACLPDDRWQTEAQLKGQTLLEEKTVRVVYTELCAGGFVESKSVPILCGIGFLTGEFMRMYRTGIKRRKKYTKERERSFKPLKSIPSK